MSKVVLSDFPFPGDHLLVAAQAVMEVTLFCLVDVHRTVGLHVGHWVLDCSGGGHLLPSVWMSLVSRCSLCLLGVSSALVERHLFPRQ